MACNLIDWYQVITNQLGYIKTVILPHAENEISFNKNLSMIQCPNIYGWQEWSLFTTLKSDIFLVPNQSSGHQFYSKLLWRHWISLLGGRINKLKETMRCSPINWVRDICYQIPIFFAFHASHMWYYHH